MPYIQCEDLPAIVIGVGLEVKIFYMRCMIDWVDTSSRERVDVCERPAITAHMWGDNAHNCSRRMNDGWK